MREDSGRIIATETVLGTGFEGEKQKSKDMNIQKAAIALAKTIERLAEKNLILEDSLALSYDGHAKISPYLPDEVENVIISFNCIRGFRETFVSEYNRLTEYDFEEKETENGVEVKTTWIE